MWPSGEVGCIIGEIIPTVEVPGKDCLSGDEGGIAFGSYRPHAGYETIRVDVACSSHNVTL
jgi:hypothetical protein